MYDGFTPVAVLDWEMAGLAPREVDLAWMFYLHRFFEEIAHVYGLPGLPDMFRFDDVVETYTRLTGHEPRNMEWYLVYTALRYAVVSLRTSSRGVHFGDREAPADPDDLIMHRAAMEKMVDGSYWATLRDGAGHRTTWPALTRRYCPVTARVESETKNSTASATSPSVAMVRSGIGASTSARTTSSATPREAAVSA